MEANCLQDLTFALIVFIIIVSIIFIGLYKIKRDTKAMNERLEKEYERLERESKLAKERIMLDIERTLNSFKPRNE